MLSKYQPRLIKTEEENDRALEIVEALMHQSDRSPEEDELYDLLIVLIEKFEQDYYQPELASTPQSVLLFLMEQQGVEEMNLIEVFGSEAGVAEAVGGNCDFSGSQIRALGTLFRVDPVVFL